MSTSTQPPAYTDSVNEYLRQISKIPLLTQPEEQALGRKIRAGDEDAVCELVKHNLRFGFSIAKKYQGRGIELLELASYATEGLIAAAKKFDPDRGRKYITFAVWDVRKSIHSALGELGALRLSTPARRALRNVEKRVAELEGQYNAKGHPYSSREEIVTEAIRQIAPTKTKILRRAYEKAAQAQAFISLEDTLYDGEKARVSDTISDLQGNADIPHQHVELTDTIDAAFQTLKPREAQALRLIYGIETGEGMTLEETGAIMGVTRERIRQLRNRALGKLRTQSSTKALVPFYNDI
jgi:RNA polymerase primary sigma factor